MTNDFSRRYRQHNKEIKGGAKYTSKREGWYPICIIDGFLTMKEACQCEWAVKHSRKIQGFDGPLRRVLNLNLLLTKERWTSKSPKIKDQNITIYIDDDYREQLTVEAKELYWR